MLQFFAITETGYNYTLIVVLDNDISCVKTVNYINGIYLFDLCTKLCEDIIGPCIRCVQNKIPIIITKFGTIGTLMS